jgi:hypothetical protein
MLIFKLVYYDVYISVPNIAYIRQIQKKVPLILNTREEVEFMKASREIFTSNVANLLERGYNREEIIKDFIRINEEVWAPPIPQDVVWTHEMMEQQLVNCPELLYCTFVEGQMVGTVTAIYVDEQDALNSTSWKSISGNGTLSTHKKNGNTAFGIDLSIPPKFRGLGISDQLVKKSFLISGILSNKKGVYLGSRVPSFHKHSKTMSIEECVFGKNRDGKTVDWEIRMYQKDGFKVKKIVPDYMEDPESLNYGVLMFWENPLYKLHLPLHWLKPLVKKIILD